MRIPRIYQALPLQTGGTITLDAQAATHVVKVLRLKPAEQIIVFDGQGGEYTGVIKTIDKRAVIVQLQSYEERGTESPLQISLVQGVSRSERMDYTLQKAVELGVCAIYPVTTQHMAVHLDTARAQKKQTHWQGIVNSACEQSGRVAVPPVHAVQTLHHCIDTIATIEGQLMVVLDHRATVTLAELDRHHKNRIAVIAGPEGGWSTEERTWLIASGANAVAMGPRILRTETAALAAIAILQALWGDFK
ncbi:MAG TPA: 16S rRNA (uracil(1498)-N(3))-methyltransferase [Gammaproteobacteria bacterium]